MNALNVEPRVEMAEDRSMPQLNDSKRSDRRHSFKRAQARSSMIRDGGAGFSAAAIGLAVLGRDDLCDRYSQFALLFAR